MENAAAMTADLVGRRGRIAPVLGNFPNGHSTSTLASFDSLANLVAECRLQNGRCGELLLLGGEPGAPVADPASAIAPDTLAAMVSIARNPWHHVGGLFELSRRVRGVYRPALEAGERPDAWALALRFEGVPETMDGPGNFAIDAKGSLWVVNSYEYSRDLSLGVCGGEQLLRFTPTGAGYPGSPYGGGGLSGAGFGITFDPRGRLWAGNFGFAGKGCERIPPPPSNSVSLFSAGGEALSPEAGFTNGAISWPQGTVSDRAGDIWIANCGNNSVTRYPNGDPALAANLTGLGLERPFGAAVGRGVVAVAGAQSATVALLDRSGKPLPGSPVSGHGLSRPLGVASDSRGYFWVANSGKIIPPCKGNQVAVEEKGGEGSVTLLKPNGEPARAKGITGGGIVMPWGIAVDGADNVWVANFSGQRLSQLCGTRPRSCPPGKRRTGRAISPARTGYGFDGLVRNTGSRPRSRPTPAATRSSPTSGWRRRSGLP
ncbi:MAG: hypothetical protein ACOYD4_07760 [Solirubrobacterales bacterium]